MDDPFEQLEDRVLEMLLTGDHPVLRCLRKQLAQIASRKREFSGVGFFTHFKLNADVSRLIGLQSFAFGDIDGEMEGLKFGVGFLLFVRDGLIDFLECYTYDEFFPRNIQNVKLTYRFDMVDRINSLRKNKMWPEEMDFLH